MSMLNPSMTPRDDRDGCLTLASINISGVPYMLNQNKTGYLGRTLHNEKYDDKI